MQPINGLSLIVAMSAEKRVIGRGNKLPWNIFSDLRRFKEITTGHPVIMGRKNWESIPEKFRPLPGRTNIVLTRQRNYEAEGAAVVYSMQEAHEVATHASGAEEIFVIGGEEIYRQFLPRVHRAYITIVFAPIEGDTHFPLLEPSRWERIECTAIKRWHQKDDHPTSFEVYQQK